MCSLLFFYSMTSLADQNDQWASYAGPGGWNGIVLLLIFFNILHFLTPFQEKRHDI